MFDIEEWVKDNMDRPRRSKGDEWTATCPSCGKWSKFYVNTDTGKWVCFFEEDFRGSRIWSLIAFVEGITVSQARAEVLRRNIKFARRRKLGMDALSARVASLRGREAEGAEITHHPLPKEYVPVYSEKRKRQWLMPKYLKNRGIKKATARDYGLGFCRGGDFDGRIIIPIICPNGTSFTARGTQDWHKPKYLNATGADHSRFLIGWDNLDIRSDVVLVEGPTDVLMAAQNGLPALGLGGKELHDPQLGLLCRKPPDCSVIVMVDPEAGVEAFGIASKLLVRFPNVFIGTLTEGVDPGSATRTQIWAAYDSAVRFTGSRVSGLSARVKKVMQSR